MYSAENQSFEFDAQISGPPLRCGLSYWAANAGFEHPCAASNAGRDSLGTVLKRHSSIACNPAQSTNATTLCVQLDILRSPAQTGTVAANSVDHAVRRQWLELQSVHAHALGTLLRNKIEGMPTFAHRLHTLYLVRSLGASWLVWFLLLRM